MRKQLDGRVQEIVQLRKQLDEKDREIVAQTEMERRKLENGRKLLPYSIRILLESAIRNCDDFQVTKNDVEKIIDWENTSPNLAEIPFKPSPQNRYQCQILRLEIALGKDSSQIKRGR
ncbi:uncharacterized protein [Lolium perenne]|uniref:uncharacterized protein isoform X1 n=1 Tax=Lolium perenne TaxID=4522 RepID=UPI003A9A093E